MASPWWYLRVNLVFRRNGARRVRSFVQESGAQQVDRLAGTEMAVEPLSIPRIDSGGALKLRAKVTLPTPRPPISSTNHSKARAYYQAPPPLSLRSFALSFPFFLSPLSSTPRFRK